MINYTNIKEYKSLPFESYIGLKGFSHSFLKNEQNGVARKIEVNDKMRLGSLVDAFLTQPDEIDFNSNLFDTARTIAIKINEQFKDVIKHLEPQLSYSAETEFNGFKMPVCGRLDWLLRGIADVDLKVTSAKNEKQFINLLFQMGYDNQQWNYAKMANVPKIYIMPFSTTSNRCLDLIELPVTETNKFWEEKILKFGTYE